MSIHEQIFKSNNLDLAKKILFENNDISAELFWSLLFWKTPELLFLSIRKSTKISKEQLSSSLNKIIINDFNQTFDSIMLILTKLSDIIEIQSLYPIESHSSNSIFPNLQEVVYIYSTIIYTIFPYINEEQIHFKTPQRIQLTSILCRTKAIMSNNNLIYKDFDRIMQKVNQLIDIKYGLLKGLLSGIADQITQVPIIQQLKFE